MKNTRHIIKATFFFLLTCVYTQVFAAQWSSTSISYLAGDGYKSPGSSTTSKTEIMTLEHASGWEYGDNYFFTDVSGLNSTSLGVYTEWAPRISSKKIWNKDYGSFVDDILLSGQLNFTNSSSKIHLIGFAIDLKIPTLDFFKVNLYSRDNPDVDGTSSQVTLVWSKTFMEKLKFMGFIDYATAEGTGASKKEANLLAQPQLYWMARKSLGVGIEYQYWSNKYGVKDLDESLAQLMIKWDL